MNVFNYRLKPGGTGFSLWMTLLSAALFALPAFAQLDLSGEWAPRFHEDQPERIPGPEIGDYLGLPINDAARPANLRRWKEVDSATQQIIAWHTHISWQAVERTIYMDGRPHPPEYVAH